MGVLNGRVVIVAGATACVGERIAAALLREGAVVAVPFASLDEAEAFRRQVGAVAGARLLTPLGSVDSAAAAERVRSQVVRSHGHPDAAVAVFGSERTAGNGSAPTRGDARVAHRVFARALLPAMVVRGRGSYTLVHGFTPDGPAGEDEPLLLHPGLVRELAASGVRLNELVLGPVMTRARSGPGDPGWITGDDVGEMAVALVSGGLMMTGKVIRIADLRAFERFPVPA